MSLVCAQCGNPSVSLQCGHQCGTPYCSTECGKLHWVLQHQILCERRIVGSKRGKGGRPVSREKAREILHHGQVHGKPLTEQQRKYFGYWSN